MSAKEKKEQKEICLEEINQIETDIGINKEEIQRLFKLQKKLYKRKVYLSSYIKTYLNEA